MSAFCKFTAVTEISFLAESRVRTRASLGAVAEDGPTGALFGMDPNVFPSPFIPVQEAAVWVSCKITFQLCIRMSLHT